MAPSMLETIILVGPQLTALTFWGWPSRLLAALRTLDYLRAAQGPVECGREAQARVTDVAALNTLGTMILPRLTLGLTQKEAQQTMVIFDGEKRFGAWRTYQKIKEKVAVAVFDDTNIGADGAQFVRHLKQREVQFGTTDSLWDCYRQTEKGPLSMLQPLQQLKTADGRRPQWHGGIHNLAYFHFSIVAGLGWGQGENGTCAKVARAADTKLCP